MKLLALLHQWAGGITGLLLAIIGLSGAILVWEESWISLQGAGEALVTDSEVIGASVEAALAIDPALSRVTFANEEMGLHQAVYIDGSGAYLTQAGEVVDRWETMWGRPELWLFDLHHYLFMGDFGKYLTGVLGLLLLAFSVTGLILWWRTRKTFEFRLWPKRMTKSAIVRQHRDLGTVASPLLILLAFTGAMMIFPALSAAILSPWTGPARQAPALPDDLAAPGPQTDWSALMTNAQTAFPEASPRRLMFPAEPGAPLALRMKQDFEWTPNGRTYVWLDPGSGEVLATDDPARGDTASRISEKYYPLHAGKVGGVLWCLLLTFAGLALVTLGGFATFSFWAGGKAPRPARRRVRAVAEPAE